MVPNPSGGGWRGLHTVRGISLLLGGALLFAAARKLVWGTTESLTAAELWIAAILPILIGLILMSSSWSTRMILGRVGWILSSVWIISLLLFVLLRATGAASIFEDHIYSTFDPGTARYLTLSLAYAALGNGFVKLCSLALRARQSQFIDSIVGFVIVALLFYFVVFTLSF